MDEKFPVKIKSLFRVVQGFVQFALFKNNFGKPGPEYFPWRFLLNKFFYLSKKMNGFFYLAEVF